MYRNFILLFILLIVVVYIVNYKYEHFETNENPNVYSNKNLFLDKDSNNNYNLDNLNINKLCIQNPDDPNDIVCIRKDELFNTLSLPEFRKHSVCIDDACITNNNISKLNGDSNVNFESKNNRNSDGKLQCLGMSTIDVDTSDRVVAKWEEGRKYYGPNKPEDGWKKKCYTCGPDMGPSIGKWRRKLKDKTGKKHCRPRFRGSKINTETNISGPDGSNITGLLSDRALKKRTSEIEYDYSIVGVNEDDAVANRYGCTAKHDISSNICWASSGGKCDRALKTKRGWTKSITPNKQYTYEGSKIKGLETLKDQTCPEKFEENNKSNFVIKHGVLLNDFDLLDKNYKTNNYIINRHDEHTPIE